MKAIFGLGNPGREYAQTRHNVGWLVADALAARLGASWRRAHLWRRGPHGGLWARGLWRGQALLVGKPETFMNLSGEFVSQAAGFYKIEPGDILAAHDDLDLPLGTLRLARGGSAAGHKGVQSILDRLGTNAFSRLKVGIGKAESKEQTVGFVLSAFTPSERETVQEVVGQAVEAALTWVDEGLEAAMNRHNRRPRKARDDKADDST